MDRFAMPTSNLAPDATPATNPARVFVGLKIEDQIARELARIAQELEGPPQICTVAADDIHLTLVPPWEENSIPEAIAKLGPVAAQFGAFALIIQHVGYGPDRRWPRLLWADCAAVDALSALREMLLLAFNQTDEKPFRPHVTLARIRGNGRLLARRHPIDRPLTLRQWIQSVELFQSPAPGERGYRVLASLRLGETSA